MIQIANLKVSLKAYIQSYNRPILTLHYTSPVHYYSDNWMCHSFALGLKL